MPVSFPVTFDPGASAAAGTTAATATNAATSSAAGPGSSAVLSDAAGLECYLPQRRGVSLSLRHWHQGTETREFGRLSRGNALCASRARAVGLVAALDARSLALLPDAHVPA